MGRGTVSVRLTNGTVVSTSFDDNSDGRVGTEDNGEAERALDALRAHMDANGLHGSLINPDAKIMIVESGAPGGANHRVDIAAGSLLRGGTARLFTSPEAVLTDQSWVHGDMWSMDGNVEIGGVSYTRYREADRWEDGHHIRGRTIAVPAGYTAVNCTWRNIMVDETTLPGSPSGDPQWTSLGTIYDRNERNTAAYGGTIPSRSLSYVANAPALTIPAPVDTAVPWTADPRGPQPDGFQYYFYQAPNAPNVRMVARRSIAYPSESHILERPGPNGSLEGATWRGADAADGVPLTIRVGNGDGAQFVHLTRANPPSSGTPPAVVYDMYVGTRAGTGETLTIRRAHGIDNAGYEVQQGGNWVDAPAVRLATTVTVGAGANAQTYTLAPADPATAGDYDMFTGTRSGSSVTLTLRRRHGVADAPYEVREGTRWVTPADYGSAPAGPPRTPRTGGGNPPRRNTGPDVFY